MAEIALRPAEPQAHRLDHLDAALERLPRRGAVAAMGHPGGLRRGQLQRVELVVVEGAEIDGIAFAPALRQSVDVDEEVEAFFGLVGQKLDMAEMRHVE